MRGRPKWLSLLLAFSITFLAIAPQLSMAASSKNSSGSEVQAPSATLHKSVTRLTELVDKRDQHTKTFLNSDGSYTAETSYASRHYKNAEGEWEDISNKIGTSSNDPTFAFRSQANPLTLGSIMLTPIGVIASIPKQGCISYSPVIMQQELDGF